MPCKFLHTYNNVKHRPAAGAEEKLAPAARRNQTSALSHLELPPYAPNRNPRLNNFDKCEITRILNLQPSASFMNSMLETVTKGSFRIHGRPTQSSAGSARALRRGAVRDLENRTRTATARAVLKSRYQNSAGLKRTLCTRPKLVTAECTPPTCAEVTCILAQLEPPPAWQGRRHAGEHMWSVCYPDTCI
jgi:hypothetical protein